VALGGPHALLMFAAICVSLGAPPATAPGEPAFADPAAGTEALELMADLLAHADPRLAGRNPIAVLDAMAAGGNNGHGDGGPVYCPLVYGYLTYQRPRPGNRALAAFDAPARPGRDGRSSLIGSVLGGTGIAVTRSCTQLAAARGHLLRLMSPEVQIGRYSELGGQSADRRAWLDPDADRRSGGFYSATRRTVEAAWVRPRFAGYVAFQAGASAVLRDGLLAGLRPGPLLSRVNEMCARAGGAAARRAREEHMTQP
jgi:multiple sugar transport system substrate-binding protein